LRDKTFSTPILYDLIKEDFPVKPEIKYLFDLRKSIIVNDKTPKNLVGRKGIKPILAFLKKFRDSNALWCQLWYNHFPDIGFEYPDQTIVLPIMDYEHSLETYVPINSQERYEQNVLRNIQLAYRMLGLTGELTKFTQCEEALHNLEDKIIMEDLAQAFHQRYTQSKIEEKLSS
jgi:hypothetical protein